MDWSNLIYYEQHLPDGLRIQVIPLTFGRARLCIGAANDPIGYSDGW